MRLHTEAGMRLTPPSETCHWSLGPTGEPSLVRRRPLPRPGWPGQTWPASFDRRRRSVQTSSTFRYRFAACARIAVILSTFCQRFSSFWIYSTSPSLWDYGRRRSRCGVSVASTFRWICVVSSCQRHLIVLERS